MKIVVIGGTGLIGSKLVTRLREHGHEAVAASPETGVNTLTGEGRSAAVRVGRTEATRRDEQWAMDFTTPDGGGAVEAARIQVVGRERVA